MRFVGRLEKWIVAMVNGDTGYLVETTNINLMIVLTKSVIKINMRRNKRFYF